MPVPGEEPTCADPPAGRVGPGGDDAFGSDGNSLVQARRLTRSFGSFTAVASVDMRVAAGEVVGLLGANGAGKTTLIRLVLGLLRPSGGSVRLFGAPPSRRTRTRVGYVPQSLGLYDDLSVGENWRFAAGAFHLADTRLPEELSPWRDVPVGDLPLGLARQVAFAVALAHRPELLVLDEPTSGVGPLGGARLWEQIRASAETGAGVLVTTHNMEEAEQCDRLVVMVDGRVAARGTVQELIGDRTVTEVRPSRWPQAFSWLEEHRCSVALHGTALRVDRPADEVAALLSAHDPRAEVREVAANLEEAFVAIVRAGSPPVKP